MQGDEFDSEIRTDQQQRWEHAITISILAVIASGILGFAAQDAFFAKPPRRSNPTQVCITNLKAIDEVKGTWALDYHTTNSDAPTDTEIFGVINYMREKPVCPLGGTYTLGPVLEKPRCSIPSHTI